MLQSQPPSTLAQLEPLAHEFFRRYSLRLHQELRLEPAQQLRIAAEACLPVVSLGLDWYSSVREIVVYPAAFPVNQSWMDDDGIEHLRHTELAGEVWSGGSVILAWEEIELGGMPGHEHYNVVVHEFAHVLDAVNGAVNGFPPIRDPALASRWPHVFQQAFDAEQSASLRGETTVLDEYSTENPGEFFAVASEHYFTQPQGLQQNLPALFDCLHAFYSDDSENRITRAF